MTRGAVPVDVDAGPRTPSGRTGQAFPSTGMLRATPRRGTAGVLIWGAQRTRNHHTSNGCVDLGRAAHP